ncbi:uncharacterized protein LOC122528657 [Frieseomelitta varia]|uniref:uncharacterized protein LOC122528657 n=1 Tax=Frieseomelitta varia TaxID=561572 RepID=UPI001CB687E1|nr:uncharacterized protein LOC122528657 [Frieseomelitta varia]XP_043509951.1 uncharacterized protein LOC122528657 [Frieseomelitta varia]
MLKGYTITAFLTVFTCSSFGCNYICNSDGCKRPTNNSKYIYMKYCANEDIFTNVNFSIIEDQNASESLAILQINLQPPKNRCKYVLTLLANPSVSETRCMNYKFHNFRGTETHTKSAICFVPDEEQYQNTTRIFVPYIFTACYSVQFFFGKDATMIKHNKFIKTKYIQTAIMKPTLECTYDYNTFPDNIEKKTGHLEVHLHKPMVTAGVIKLGRLWYDSSGNERCSFNNEEFSNDVWSFDVLDEYLGNKNHDFNTTLLMNEIYKRNLTFQTEISQKANYCISIFPYHDIRCINNTLWKPNDTCLWYQSCKNITIYNLGIQTNINYDTVSHLYLPITIIALTVFTITMYFIYIIHFCNIRKKSFYTNSLNRNILKTNETKCMKSKIYTSIDYQKKVKCKDDNITNTDIVLLYPKGSESFMALMADFRGLLNQICVVHDWYDGKEWNYVAEIGAFDWFAEMLYKECRVVWIDTPIMRSLITQRLNKNSFLKNSEQYSFVKIGDFRDAVFPTIFNLSKRNNEQSVLHKPKHFIVRLKEFDNFENDSDPFVDLSPHMRYFIPQNLNLLCSDLSTLNSNIIVPFKSEEDLKQHLHYAKLDFYK